MLHKRTIITNPEKIKKKHYHNKLFKKFINMQYFVPLNRVEDLSVHLIAF